jgi:hypothetical protein
VTRASTPGPWHTGDIGRKGLGWCTIFSDTTPIARALSLHKTGERKSADFDIEAANARLIAAAPDLLQAVKLLQVRVFMSEGSENGAYRMANAAIQKAEGKS